MEKKEGSGWEISFPLVLSSAIDFLYLKEMFVSDLETPVCSLAPAIAWSLEKEKRLKTTDDILYQTQVSIGSKVFGKKFSSYNELETYLSKIPSPEFFFSQAKDTSVLLDPQGSSVSISAFQQYKSYFEKKYRRSFGDDEIYGSLLRGNFSMITYDLAYHGKFKTVMSTDFKGVWKNLLWLMQNSKIKSSKVVREEAQSKDSCILQALQEDNIRWLGNIPLNKINEMRERGELQELRELLGKNIETIEDVSDEEFFEVGQQVKYNIEQAIKRHSNQVHDLDDKYRSKYELDATSLIVSGALAITASFFPPLAGVASLVGGTSLYSIIKNYREKREKIKELQRKPVGMLFNAYQT